MFKIQTLNNISPRGLERLPRAHYEVGSQISDADGILLRSFNMHEMPIPTSLKAVARAGAGVNNIPIEHMNRRGIPVFNAPGANANAVKELVIAGMLLACRNICQAWGFASGLQGDDAQIHQQVEVGKKRFSGFELPGRTLGVVGLGAIGVQVANAAGALGMRVLGYDPTITVQRAWQLSSQVEQAETVEALLARADFVSLHVPLIDGTRDLINRERLRLMRKDAVVLNFSRAGIVDEKAVCEALDEEGLYAYVCDFPSNGLKGHARAIALPHLGASTLEAEDNCAVMVADQLRDFLEHGNIRNAVNFPDVFMAHTGAARLSVANLNRPDMVGQISHFLGQGGLNILRMMNESRGELAYTLVDVESPIGEDTVETIRRIDGVLNVRALPAAD